LSPSSSPTSSTPLKSSFQIPENKTNTHETQLPLLASLSKSKEHTNYTSSGHHLQDRGTSPLQSTPTDLITTVQHEKTQAQAVTPEVNLSKAESRITEIPKKNPVPEDSITATPLNNQVLANNTNSGPQETKKKTQKSKNLNFDAGVYYSPEWMFNTLEGEKYVNNFGLEGIFHMGNYSIRTGLGLSITKGTNEILIKTNDYLGDFNKLDSLNFKWDATHTHLIPTYYFTKKSVWDSIVKTQYSKIIKRYTYLQIPIILGYDFWKNDFVTLGARTGPILSVLLKTEQLSENYDPGKDRVVQENLISPERIQTYWQFMAGIEAGFSLNKRVSIEVEPEIRYYFNSVYEQPQDNKKPWSLGFRAAFIIKN
jgi:hypothetical protein